jgi:peptidoglycan/LPS O-acetylase OafA/YrhL
MQHKLFFPNLDGLRFFAFFFVFMFHCYFGIPTEVSGNVIYRALHRLWENGDLGVNCFFVLSGFLITYLLLHEERQNRRINIAHFYLRRILRIWPLYYVTFLFGYFIFQYLIRLVGAQVAETANPWYYVFFAGNFNSIVHGDPVSGTLSVLWSIAIEEQFYLCWPLLLIVFRKNRPLLFAGIISLSLGFRMFHIHDRDLLFYHTFSVMSDLAIGAWLSWWCFTKKWEQNSLNHFTRAVSVLIYAIGFALIFFRKELFVHPALLVFERLLYGLFFAFIIAEQCFFARPLFRMEKLRWPTYWGKYTYALYCLHMPAMVFTEGFAMMGNVATELWWLLWGKTVSTLLLSLAFSRLSYRFIERPFLRLKTRFEAVG